MKEATVFMLDGRKNKYWTLKKERNQLIRLAKDMDKTSQEYETVVARIGEITETMRKSFPQWIDPAVKIGTFCLGLAVMAKIDGNGGLIRNMSNFWNRTTRI